MTSCTISLRIATPNILGLSDTDCTIRPGVLKEIALIEVGGLAKGKWYSILGINAGLGGSNIAISASIRLGGMMIVDALDEEEDAQERSRVDTSI
jgi:hypothetical protein